MARKERQPSDWCSANVFESVGTWRGPISLCLKTHIRVNAKPDVRATFLRAPSAERPFASPRSGRVRTQGRVVPLHARRA